MPGTVFARAGDEGAFSQARQFPDDGAPAALRAPSPSASLNSVAVTSGRSVAGKSPERAWDPPRGAAGFVSA